MSLMILKRSKPTELEKDLVFVGLTGMIDPPRTEVKPALEHARHAGIRTVMITGDFPNTAKAIAEAIGLLRPGKKVMTGAQLDKLDDNELKNIIEDTDVFARVSPEHKMRIVDALQANDEIVAMTGDGVNDAPAIKRADIGVAMGITGTDVAKETADMVLTDDNYASIVCGRGAGTRHLQQHPQVRVLPAFFECGRDHDHLPRHAGGSARSADGHSTLMAQPHHRRRARAGSCHGKGRSRYHGS